MLSRCLLYVRGLMCALVALSVSSAALADPAAPDLPADVASLQARGYQCHRAGGPIAVDGRLDEPAWERARPLTIFLVPPAERSATPSLRRSASRVTAHLLWDDTHLYLGATIEDRDLHTRSTGHDSPFGEDDVLELFVKPSRQRSGYWEFHVTPAGATRDYLITGRGGDEASALAGESGMRAAVTLDGTLNRHDDVDVGWTAEMAIPLSAFASVGATAPSPGRRWLSLVARYDYSVYLPGGVEHSAAALLPELNYHLTSHYPRLVFRR